VSDPVCGAGNQLRAVKQTLDGGPRFLNAAIEAGQALPALMSQRPVWDRAAVARLLADVESATRGEPRDVQDALVTLRRALDELGRTLAAGLVKEPAANGIEATRALVPYAREVALCAGVLAVATAEIAGASATTIGGASACPATGVTCVATAVSVMPQVAVLKVTSTAADAVCGGAVVKGRQLDDEIERVETFVKSLVAAPATVAQAVKLLDDAASALAAIAKSAKGTARQRVTALADTLARFDASLDQFANAVDSRVGSKLGAAAGRALGDTTQAINQVLACHARWVELSSDLSQDYLDAVAALTAASVSLVDGARVITNLVTQGQSAVTAAEAAARQAWGTQHERMKRLHRDLWGVDHGVVNPAVTVTHLSVNGPNPAWVSERARDLADAAAGPARIVSDAVLAGRNAFLNLDATATTARGHYQTALAKANEAAAAAARARQRSAPAPTVVKVRMAGSAGQIVRAKRAGASPVLAAVPAAPAASPPALDLRPEIRMTVTQRASALGRKHDPSSAQSIGSVFAILDTRAPEVIDQSVAVYAGASANTCGAPNRHLMRPSLRIGAGGTQSQSMSLTALANFGTVTTADLAAWATGALYLCAQVDVANQVAESNESNNCRCVRLP
jgi:hypothetical protein